MSAKSARAYLRSVAQSGNVRAKRKRAKRTTHKASRAEIRRILATH